MDFREIGLSSVEVAGGSFGSGRTAGYAIGEERTSPWRDLRGPARGKCPAPTPPHTLNYRAHSSEIDNTTQDCCLATSPCRSAHQTGMPMAAESCQNTSAAAAQLQATLCQPRSSKVKDVERQEQRRTLRDRPAPSAPPQTLLAHWRLSVTKPDMSTRTKGGWVFNGGQSVGTAADSRHLPCRDLCVATFRNCSRWPCTNRN